MKIFALDLATTTGFAIGDTGGAPLSGSVRLKTSDDEPERAFKKLAQFLRDHFSANTYDLVIVEAPVNIGAFVQSAPESERGFKFTSNPATIYLLSGLAAVAYGISGCYGFRCVKANVQQVRKHFLGVARPENPKQAVVARCKQLRYIPTDCRDDNQADACALWDFAASHYGRAATASVFGGAPAHG